MGRGYIYIPGTKTHELPPLLVHAAETGDLGDVLSMATGIVESEDILTNDAADAPEMEQRKHDLALNLTEQYLRLLAHWQWGDSILEWIRQCEITFETTPLCGICCTRMCGRTPAAAVSCRCWSKRICIRRWWWKTPWACA